MQIHSLFQTKPCVFSVEVFPPKRYETDREKLYSALSSIAQLKPDFISVTYGAGATKASDSTCEIASYIQNELNIPALAHLTCVNLSKPELYQTLDMLKSHHVENILALRGDVSDDVAPKKEFLFASDLAAEICKTNQFGVSGACYPEGHMESENLTQDVKNLQYKINAGVTHLISQLFFDNVYFYRFLNMARKAGYTLPIQAGIMPIVNEKQISHTIALSSASLPPQFTKMISKYYSNPQALFDAGIDYAIRQIRDLIIGGADGIHLYTMNNPKVLSKVYNGIADLL